MDRTSHSELTWTGVPAATAAARAAVPAAPPRSGEPALDTMKARYTVEESGQGAGATGLLGAFERLFVREYPRVVAAAYRVLGDEHAAEDAAQEAFVDFQRRYPADAPFAAAWLHAAAVHGALNRLRAERRRQRRESDPSVAPGTSDGAAAAMDAADPATVVVAAETRREVRRALARMAPRNAAVLVLRYSGLSYAEVATVLGVPVNQVGTLLRRAEAGLRKELHDVASE
jgi:RNA polymerase sigma factor (sigma-70 family)